MMLSTIIIRHKKENLNKCSLRGLETRPDMQFFKYPFTHLPSLQGYCMLVLDNAEELHAKDANSGLLLLDSTWRYLPHMIKSVEAYERITQQKIERRILPSCYQTAYPRRQEDCSDPSRGLSSLEALYIAYHILGRPVEGLLEQYFWKDKFLEINNL